MNNESNNRRKVQRTETDFQLQEMQSLDKSKLTSSDI